MRKIFILFILVSSASLNAQHPGDKYWEMGRLDSAMLCYGMSLMSDPTNSEMAMKLTETLALTYQVDTAFYFLNMAVANDSTLWPLANFHLFSLVQDPRWSLVEDEQFRKYELAHGKLKNPEYARQLIRMIMKDQSLDYYTDQAKAAFMQNGYAPHWYYPISAYKAEIGKQNYEELSQLIDQYGWPTYSMVGDLAADAPLLVINHHEDPEVRKKYIKSIKKACKAGETSCFEYARIQDRILVEENKEQLYGMQFRYNDQRQLEPFPVADPQLVDQRRAEIGLEPLKDYLKKRIGYNWEIKQVSN